MTTVFVDNTNAILLEGLHDELSDSYINDATVTVTVKDAADVNVVGVTWPLTMAYVAASNGNYRAAISDLLELVASTKYYAHITANAGADRVGRWTFMFKPKTRTGLNEA